MWVCSVRADDLMPGDKVLIQEYDIVVERASREFYEEVAGEELPAGKIAFFKELTIDGTPKLDWYLFEAIGSVDYMGGLP